jgi:hypothetical protein
MKMRRMEEQSNGRNDKKYRMRAENDLRHYLHPANKQTRWRG